MRRRKGFYETVVKPFMGRSIGMCTTIILSPLFIGISGIIRVTSKGPVIFKQERVGLNQEVFEIYKFRTMIENAENIGDGLRVSGESDPRITKVGKWLRKTSLDELPQFINMAKGDMALIGPRPPATYHPYKVGYYDSRKKHRFDVKPGITGLAQASIRNSGTWDERIEYDLKYVNNVSFHKDMRIIHDTLLMLFDSKSIY